MSSESIVSKITGKVAGSDDNQSGLMSELHTYLTQGGFDAIVSRAQSKGLGDTVESWRGAEHAAPTSAETIRALFDQSEIEGFSSKTGQNESGVVSALATQLPRAVGHLSD